MPRKRFGDCTVQSRVKEDALQFKMDNFLSIVLVHLDREQTIRWARTSGKRRVATADDNLGQLLALSLYPRSLTNSYPVSGSLYNFEVICDLRPEFVIVYFQIINLPQVIARSFERPAISLMKGSLD